MNQVQFVNRDAEHPYQLINETCFHWCHDKTLLAIGVKQTFINTMRQRQNQTTRTYEKIFPVMLIQNTGPCQTIPKDIPLDLIVQSEDVKYDIIWTTLKHILYLTDNNKV